MVARRVQRVAFRVVPVKLQCGVEAACSHFSRVTKNSKADTHDGVVWHHKQPAKTLARCDLRMTFADGVSVLQEFEAATRVLQLVFDGPICEVTAIKFESSLPLPQPWAVTNNNSIHEHNGDTAREK